MIRYATISLWLSCLVLALSCIGMTERALAQVECPGASGDDGNSTQVTWIRATGGSCASGLASQSDYNDPSTTSSNYTFMLFLPGDAPVAGGANNVKFMARNASGAALNITQIYCYRYNLGFVNYPAEAPTTGVGSTIGTVELDDGDECDLKIQFEDTATGDEISYVGRIFSRVGDTYSIRGGSLVGGDFGITAPTETGQAGTFERNGKLLVSLYQYPLPSRVVINSDTDEVERQTVGQPFTLRYTITNIGTEQLASQVWMGRPTNLEDCYFSYISPRFTPYGTISFNVWVGHSFDVELTCTPTHATDFSFPLFFKTLDQSASVTVRGPGGDPDDPTKERTENIIKNFITRRGDQIISKEPDLTKRLGRPAPPRRSMKDAPPLKLGGPIDITGEGTEHNNKLAFSTSLRQVAGSLLALKQRRVGDTSAAKNVRGDRRTTDAGGTLDTSHSMRLGYDGYGQPQTGFGLWAEGTWARINDGTTGSDFGLLYIGADYRFRPGFVVGLLAQFDRTDEQDLTNGFSIKGDGWLAGPYVVARLSSNLIFDARAAWGRSDNEVSPYNTYADEFKGRRWLVRSRLTGDFTFGRLHVAPHIGVVYFEENQKSYIDNLGNTIDSQTVALGRVTFGPKLSTTFTRSDGATVTPHIAVHGIWDFRRTDIVDIDTGLALTGTEDFRARTEVGVTARRADGMAITAGGFYDGIGAKDFDAYGGTLRFDVPF